MDGTCAAADTNRSGGLPGPDFDGDGKTIITEHQPGGRYRTLRGWLPWYTLRPGEPAARPGGGEHGQRRDAHSRGRPARALCPRRRQPGFSLIEMGIVVVILALLLGGLLAPLAAQQDLQKTAETRRLLEEVREGLLGFAVAQGRLPCPDRLTDGDGLEDPRVDGVDPAEDGCAGGAYGGWVPWATLGVSPVDAWGRRLRYRVSRQLTRRAGDPSAAACAVTASGNPCTLELGDAGNINVFARDLVTRGDRAAANDVAAVVLSLGPNGLGGVDGAGSGLPAPPAGAEDERRNLDLDATFSARERTPTVPACRDSQPSAPPCEFDDLLVWVSPHILYNRLVSAGRLP